ncbi:hypothetical protein [Cupriavidus agavae]|uniref:hypothetical protein n=1 Tax=Cupriavidus agavae TaxID=1001822 RepID=UPI00102CCBE3|nr:hypothetical protein [Cupriavidus agavae]
MQRISAIFNEESQAKVATTRVAEILPGVIVSLYRVPRADDVGSPLDHIRSFVAEVVGPDADAAVGSADSSRSAWCKLEMENIPDDAMPALQALLRDNGGRIEVE